MINVGRAVVTRDLKFDFLRLIDLLAGILSIACHGRGGAELVEVIRDP